MAVWNWLRGHPRQLGRFLILFGVILAGFLANHGFLPQPDGEWRLYDVATIERNTVPRHGHIERSYRLRLIDGATVIEIPPELNAVFNHSLLLNQPKPTPIEVLVSDTQQNVIEAMGLRLKSGEVLLDPATVHRIHRGQEYLGVAICSVFVIAGVALNFLPRRRR